MSETAAGRSPARTQNHTVRVPKTAEIIASVLRRQIIRGELPEGSMLPSESALVEQFGVSRPSVREALRVLESEGLVAIQRGAHGGGRVKRPEMDLAARYLGRMMQFDGVTLADVWQARAMIEPVAVRMLAERADRPAAIDALQVTLNLTLEFADDVNVYASLSNKFHEQLLQFCGNRTLAILWGCLKEALHSGTLTMAKASPDRRKGQRQTEAARRRLLALIGAGDVSGAAAFWSDQMNLVYRDLMQRGGGRTTLVEVIE